jgi:MFS transporter, MCT family, solute carrier family 16 (monocarboxylic acid transporters), member 10
VGRVFDLGYLKVPFFLGSLSLVLSTFIIAQCTKYWHFLLAQGFLVGVRVDHGLKQRLDILTDNFRVKLSCGVCYGPVIGVLGHWFDKRRGFAVGLSTIGASIGGTVIPIVARALIPKVGYDCVNSSTARRAFLLIL